MDPNEEPLLVCARDLSPGLSLRLGCPLVEAMDKGTSGVPFDEWHITLCASAKGLQKQAGGKSHNFDREKKQQAQ